MKPAIQFKGQTYTFELDAGKPLKFDVIGQVPKKVLKKAAKMWRKLNPPKDEMSTAGATLRAVPYVTCRYHWGVLLRPWLTEQSKKEIPA